MNEYEAARLKLDILKETRVLLKKDVFIKKQDSKMTSARRRMRRNQIKTIKKKQIAISRTRNNQGPYSNQNTMGYSVDIHLETRKDKEANA